MTPKHSHQAQDMTSCLALQENNHSYINYAIEDVYIFHIYWSTTHISIILISLKNRYLDSLLASIRGCDHLIYFSTLPMFIFVIFSLGLTSLVFLLGPRGHFRSLLSTFSTFVWQQRPRNIVQSSLQCINGSCKSTYSTWNTWTWMCSTSPNLECSKHGVI